MADPATMLLIAGGIEAASSISEGQQIDKLSKYNAAISKSEGVAAEQKAEYDEALHRDRVRKAISSQRTGIGATGIDISGTAALGLEESAMAGELDALAIRHGGKIEKERAFKTAALEKAKGRSAKRAGVLRAGTSLLTAGARYKNA